MRLVRELRAPFAQVTSVATAQSLLARAVRERVARNVRRTPSSRKGSST